MTFTEGPWSWSQRPATSVTTRRRPWTIWYELDNA
jgi:hypothetical protein